MALSFATVIAEPDGSQPPAKPSSVRVITDCTLDSSYPAGGYALTASSIHSSLGSILDVKCNTSGGHFAQWDKTNGKLKIMTSNGAAPALLLDFTGGGSLTGIVVRLDVLGTPA